MADTDLPATGKSVSITLLMGGAVKAITDQVTSFSAKPTITRIDTKALGQSGSKIDTEFDAWEGSLELADSNGAAGDIVDAMESASRLRLPMSLILVETVYYANGTSKRYTYTEVKVISFETSNSRGQVRKATIGWATGKQRVTA